MRILFTPTSFSFALLGINRSLSVAATSRATFAFTTRHIASKSQLLTRTTLSNPNFGTARFSSPSDTNMGSDLKQVLIPISDGSEEIETTCLQDTLARFGAEVTVASVKPGGELVCTMSRGIKIMADATIEEAAKDADKWDLIVLPGGMPGAENLRDSVPLVKLLKKQKTAGKLYGAICAAPAVALVPHGLAKEGCTCYPAESFRGMLDNYSDDHVVVQENLITSQGPGTSLKFALQLGEILYDKELADNIAKAMLVTR